jgi:hypothetical protein
LQQLEHGTFEGRQHGSQLVASKQGLLLLMRLHLLRPAGCRQAPTSSGFWRSWGMTGSTGCWVSGGMRLNTMQY